MNKYEWIDEHVTSLIEGNILTEETAEAYRNSLINSTRISDAVKNNGHE